MSDHDSTLKAIRIANIAAGGVSSLVFVTQLSYIFTSFMEFIRAIFGLAFAIPLVYLEFKPINGLARFASFYYSYLGRGALFILLSSLMVFEGALPIIAVFLLFIGGLVFIALEFTGTIPEPDNFRFEGSGLTVGGDDDEII
ncbi:HGL145Cp [Eremothecium sinecaudum]|uniref:HGL145Cp n=1 Tax=Eremothecium sinecaudum TaxID=45286 RepID=A0A0X8HVE5_9SACH|nr:HGL145Cp [Eremothecium sinecaudum]AMD22195.1 HGL145Cp [Eremothecium sinecaudum]